MSTKNEVSEVSDAIAAEDTTDAADHDEQDTTAAEIDSLRRENAELRQRVAELEALEDRVDELEDDVGVLNSLISIGPNQSDVDLKKVFIAGVPAGKILDQVQNGLQGLTKLVTGTKEFVTQTGAADRVSEDGALVDRIDGTAGGDQMQLDRSSMLPLYRMLVDLRTGAGDSLDKSQQRAAALFERFVNKVKEGGKQNITPDGQKFTMNTEQAIEVLLEEDLLDVKEQSRSRIAGRVMRDVQRFTIADGDEHEAACTDVDGCTDHGLVTFRPGKPHTLTVPKKRMEAVVINTMQSASDKDVRTADDAVNGENTAEDSSVEAEMDRLESAEKGEKDA